MEKTYRISRDVHVGIWDHCSQTATIYPDRTIAHLPGVRWVGNSGSLHTYNHRITGACHAAIRAAMEDGADETAWEEIERYCWNNS